MNLNEKVRIIDGLYQVTSNTKEREEISKHIEDMTRLIIRFNTSKLK